LRKHILEYDDVMNKHREVFYRKRREVLEKSKISLRPYILEIIKKAGFSEEDYQKREKEVGEENMAHFEKIVCLRILDALWLEHLVNMEHLRDSVRLRAYGQQDPLVEYKSEGHKMFRRLLETADSAIARAIMKTEIRFQASPPRAAVRPPSGRSAKIGRNDPCPCGAKHPDGRPVKYKHCHGRQ
jgi:preprotein translocase subunit SecA